jgi:hypothetical protein
MMMPMGIRRIRERVIPVEELCARRVMERAGERRLGSAGGLLSVAVQYDFKGSTIRPYS